MRLLNLYIGKSLVLVTAMAIGILTFVMISANLVQAFELLAKGIPLGVIGRFMLYMMPFAFQFTIPLAVLCAAVLVFSRLSADQEVTAMRASGISLWQIVAPGLVLAAGLSVLCFYLQASLAPECRYRAYLLQRFGTVENPVGLLEAGRYVEFQNHVVYIGQKEGNQVSDLQIYVLDGKGRVTQDITARSGTVTFDEPSQKLTLRVEGFTGRQIDRSTEDDHETLRPMASNEMTYTFETAQSARRKHVSRRTKHLTVRGLLSTIYINNRIGAPTSKYYLELHKRMSMAFSPIGFLLMGIPFGIRTRRSETSVGLVISLVLAMVFYVFLSLADSLDARPKLHPEVLVWLPNIVYQVGGLIALHRISKR